jgi:hypothetical protein
MLVAKVTERRGSGRPGSEEKSPNFGDFKSASDAAKAAGISASYVKDAIDVLEFDEECGASLAKQVERGERSLWDAHAYVRKERERIRKKQREVEKLSKPTPLPPVHTPDPNREYHNYAEECLAAGEECADLTQMPGAVAFKEYIDNQDPVKIRRASWCSDVGRAMANIVSTWNSLKAIAKDKRADEWGVLPEEQEFLDELRRVTKEAGKHFRAHSKATVTVLSSVIDTLPHSVTTADRAHITVVEG